MRALLLENIHPSATEGFARAGIDVPRPPREIDISHLALLAWNAPDAVLDVACSKGTYIRVLAEDIGRTLGCGAHLAGLRRTATGKGGIVLQHRQAAVGEQAHVDLGLCVRHRAEGVFRH